MERKNFLLYHNFYNQFELLGMEDRGTLITAIFQYAKEGKTDVAMSPLVEMAFSIIRDTLDRDAESYRKTCQKNAENGKKGGRPPKKSASGSACHEASEPSFLSAKTERFFSKPKKADKDKDNDKDNDKDMDKDKDRDKDRNGSASALLIASGASLGSAVSEKKNAALEAKEVRGLLREDDREALLSLGVDGDYLREREARAIAFATEKGRGVRDVLLEWWRGDRRQSDALGREPPRRTADRADAVGGHTRDSVGSLGNSFDTDDMLCAALLRGFTERKWGDACGIGDVAAEPQMM